MMNSAEPAPPVREIVNFDNTEIAFANKSAADLRRAYWLFKLININFLVKIGAPLTEFAFKIDLPIRSLIKATIFRQFCGGETIEECTPTIQALAKGKVGTILDYSIEGEQQEEVFEATAKEIVRTIERAKGDTAIPFSVFKVTGIARFALLEKLDAQQKLSLAEEAEYERVRTRVHSICSAAFMANTPVMIDAEESWIQRTIDVLALEMMRLFNREKPIVYNTYQLYRHDKFASLKADAEIAQKKGFILGAKLVRGAYMEKERARAEIMGYISPIQPNKAAADRDYNEALRFCIVNIERIAFIAGTHNEDSCRLLMDLMEEHHLPANHLHIYFSQLLGMSDSLSFNLSHAGYNVAKYVPYGPVKAVLPYLIRRAQENTAIAGQTSRELTLIVKEIRRRKKG